MDGVFDWAQNIYKEGVAAGSGEIANLQQKAQELRIAASNMLYKKNELAKRESIYRKDPRAYEAFKTIIARGNALQNNVTAVLSRVDSILAASRAALNKMNGLGAVPIIGAAVIAGVMGTIATVAYAIHAYEKDLDKVTGMGNQLAPMIANGTLSPDQAIAFASAASGKAVADPNTKKYFLAGGACILIAIIVWKYKK